MKARKKLDRIFALLLVFTLIFNSQATALLAMEGEPVTEIAGSEVTPLSGTEGEQEIIDDNTVVIPDGEGTGDPAESVTQPEAAQGGDLVLDEESVPGSDSTSGQGDDPLTGQENAGENVAGTQELEPEPESKTEQPADAEPEIGQADPSVSEQENGQENLSGSVIEDGTGADEESGPAVDVESDSDITIVEEETEPQTLEQGADAQEPEEVETEEEYEAEVVAMGLDDEIMLTGLVVNQGATLNGVYYETVQAAIDKAENGDTVILEEGNTSVSANLYLNGKNITLDLNDRALSAPKDSPAITINDGNVTIKNGTIKSTSNGKDPSNFSSGGIFAINAELTLDEVIFNSNNRNGKGGSAIYQSGGRLFLNDVTGSDNTIGNCGNGDGGQFMFVTGCDEVSMQSVTLINHGASAGRTLSNPKYSVAYFKNCAKVEIKGFDCTSTRNAGDKYTSITFFI